LSGPAGRDLAYLAAIVDSSDDAIIGKTLDSTIVSWNRGAERLFGYSASEAVGRSMRILVPEDRSGEEDEIIARLRRGESVEHFETIRTRRDGARIDLSLTISPIRDEAGRIIGASHIARDITEKKRATEALRLLALVGAVLNESLDFERTLASLANILVPVIADWCAIDLANAAGDLRPIVVAHSNPARVELAAELRRRYPPDPAASRGAAEAFRTGEAQMMEEIPPGLIESSARDEEHRRLMVQLGLVSYMCVPIAVRDRVFGVLTLVSAESGRRFGPSDLNLARQIANLAASAIENSMSYREAKKAVQIRDDFLSVAGHELRTPLNTARLLVQLLGRRAREDERIRGLSEPIERIDRAIDRLADLVDELLDVSRISAGHLDLAEEDDVALDALVRDVAGRFEEEVARAGGSLELRVVSIRGCWDPRRLDQVLTNLLSNAIKYGEGRPIEIELAGSGDCAVLRIRDHGIGIAAKDRARIFERFERAVSGRNYGGLGLGLWISKKIVEAHRGTIQVESEPGRGATFIVTLPGAQVSCLEKKEAWKA